MIEIEIILFKIWCNLQNLSSNNINNLKEYIKLMEGVKC